MNWRLSGYHFLGVLLIASLCGVMGCSNDSYVKRNVKGPIIRDLLRGSSIAQVEGGVFTKTGWAPGKDGSLTYELPILPQGMISMDVTGLSRTAPDSIFLTLYEIPEMNYIDPYVIKNPYLITVKANNFQTAPDSPFDFLWTVKNFPTGTKDESRYVDGIPQGVLGYEKTLASASIPIFPDEKYTVQIEWFSGKASLIVNGQVVAEHDFKPLLFNTNKMQLVIGKSPLSESLDLGDATISNVWISYPTIYSGGFK